MRFDRRLPTRSLLPVLLGVLVLGAEPDRAVQAQRHGLERAGSVDERIARLLATVEQKETRQARVETEIEGLAERRAVARGRLKSRTRALYRLTRAGALPLAGGFTALLRHMSRVERLERLVRTDARALGALETRGAALRAEAGELAATLGTARRRLEELQRDKSAVDEEQRLSAMFDGAFSSAGQPPAAAPPEPSLDHGSFRVRGGGPGDFESQRGRLALPVSGPLDVREGDRGDGSGLDFLAPAGSSVRAAAEGRVAFSERHGRYGRMIIVDHGDGYFTLYGGLGEVSVRVGDWVSRGARIGDIGDDSRPSSLFFQVRRGTRPLDALSWVGL